MTNGGYNRERDGSFIGWWFRWMMVGVLITVGGFVVIVHVCNVRVEKQKEYREQCYKYGPKDKDGDRVCDGSFMPSYTSSGPYFTPSDAGR